MYFMLLSTISYEGFYGSIFPLMVKVFVITTIGLFVVRLLGRKLGTLKETV